MSYFLLSTADVDSYGVIAIVMGLFSFGALKYHSSTIPKDTVSINLLDVSRIVPHSYIWCLKVASGSVEEVPVRISGL